jgi:hypothetical protein
MAGGQTIAFRELLIAMLTGAIYRPGLSSAAIRDRKVDSGRETKDGKRASRKMGAAMPGSPSVNSWRQAAALRDAHKFAKLSPW